MAGAVCPCLPKGLVMQEAPFLPKLDPHKLIILRRQSRNFENFVLDSSLGASWPSNTCELSLSSLADFSGREAVWLSALAKHSPQLISNALKLHRQPSAEDCCPRWRRLARLSQTAAVRLWLALWP